MARVVEALASAFPESPVASIRASVDRVLRTFGDAKVRTYLPILVAREVREELAAWRAAGAQAGPVPVLLVESGGSAVVDRAG